VKLALEQADALADWEETLLDVALEAPATDCGIAFERANKAFLLKGEATILDKAEQIRELLKTAREGSPVADLGRLHDEVATFIKQGRKQLAA